MTATAGTELGAATWAERVARRRAEIAGAGRWRAPRPFDGAGPEGRLADGSPLVAFASNDYLGLTTHPAVVAAAHAALDRYGTGAGASRLVTGTRPLHAELEAALADWHGTERAVLFPTGFAANLGALATFGEAGTLICSDARNHASIVDGARLARAAVAVYPHGDLAALDQLLAGRASGAIVVTDRVFSMDGDVAPIGELADRCRRHGALLVLDDAHAVLEPTPAPGLDDADVLVVGTLSKTLGALGGYVAGPAPFVELLENRARPYIFTTAPTPADTAAAMAALGVVRSPEGAHRRAVLAGHVERIAPGHPSPIVPVVLGAEERALRASALLEAAGIWVPAIRPPSVEPGTARLRVTLSAAHSAGQVERLAAALAALPDALGREGER